MPRLLNWDLLRSPMNWTTILLMLLFGLFLIALISPQSSEG